MRLRCHYVRLKAQAKLIADPDGGSKGAGLHPSQARPSACACKRDITHYKKRFTLYIYAARSEMASAGPRFNDQQSACGLVGFAEIESQSVCGV